MTSRERLLAVLNGEIPDRVPVSTYEMVGFGCNDSFYNTEPSYKALMEVIRDKTDCICSWTPRYSEIILASAYDPAIITEHIKLDDGHAERYSIKIGNHVVNSTNRWINNINTTWTTEPWCKTLKDVDAMMDLPYLPPTYDASDFVRVQTELGDHGIITDELYDPCWLAMTLMEFGESMVWAMTETDHFAAVVDKLHQRVMTNLKNRLDSCVTDVYRICGPEYMCPPYLPPSFFERFMEPYLKDMVDLIHSYNGKARIHCHGRIGKVIDSILRTGADAIDPCEAPPDGDITLAQLKAHAGDKLCIFGNIQLKELENGTPESVRAFTLKMIEDGKANGRYIAMPTASPINTPLSPRTQENYYVYIDTAIEAGKY